MEDFNETTLYNERFVNATIINTDLVFYAIADLDKDIVFKIVQIVYLSCAAVFVCVLDSAIIYIIVSQETFRTPGNCLLFVYLLTDILQIVPYTTFVINILISDGVWYHPIVCSFQAGYTLNLGLHYQVSLCQLSFEKMMFLVYPFKHSRWFTLKKTIMVCVGSLTLCIASSVYVILVFGRNFVQSLLICQPSITADDVFSLKNMSTKFLDASAPIIIYGGLLFVVACHVRIMVAAAGHMKEIRKRAKYFQTLHQVKKAEDFKKYAVLFLIVFINLSTWALFDTTFHQINQIFFLQRISYYTMLTVSQILNPIIILIGNRILREELKRKFKLC